MTKSKRFLISTMIGMLSFSVVAVAHAKPAPTLKLTPARNARQLCVPAFLKSLTKKDAKNRKQAETLLKRFFPRLPLRTFLALYTQEISRKVSQKSACVIATRQNIMKQDDKTQSDGQKQEKSEVPGLLTALDKEEVTVVATESLYTPEEEAAKEEHGFQLGFFGGPAWQRLAELNLQQALLIRVTMSCGFFRQGNEKIGDTIRLSKEILMWFYLYNQAQGIMGCPIASAAIKILDKNAKELKTIQTSPIDWTKTKW
ncbi:hypothetical protein HY624_00440 [Candidatus Uhrbacteria bacterium]|nr:hypothetical protein [Candidatus Uhrbacteria bacterium]